MCRKEVFMIVGELKKLLESFNDNMKVVFFDYYNIKYSNPNEEINIQEFEGQCEIAFNGNNE